MGRERGRGGGGEGEGVEERGGEVVVGRERGRGGGGEGGWKRERETQTQTETGNQHHSQRVSHEYLASSQPTDRTYSLIGLDRQSHDSLLLTHNVWTVFVTGE